VFWSRPQESVILAAAMLILAAAGVLLVARRPAPPIRIIEAPTTSEVAVQVDGAVVRPGIYRLTPGARLADALAAAGGVGTDADLGGMNLARRLRDGERITVPRAAAPGPITTPESPGAVLDLNSATVEALESLPGVGPVLAGRIVEYRTSHGGFRRLDDLLQVKGVGPKLLEGLRARLVIR
jgi:competence protein ComEA